MNHFRTGDKNIKNDFFNAKYLLDLYLIKSIEKMKLLLMFSLVFSSLVVFSQDGFPKTWKTKKTIKLYGHDITREQGSGRSTPYINYKTLDQMKKEYKELSSAQMWPADSLDKVYNFLDKKAKGGRIEVELTANTVKNANTKNLTLIIQDKEGNELKREQLKNNIPSVSSAGSYVICTSYDTYYISFEIEIPFKVFLINSIYSNPKYSKTVYSIDN